MNHKLIALLFMLGGPFAMVNLAMAKESQPYGPIAIASGESPDRRAADSLNTLIGRLRVDQVGYLPNDAEKLVYYVGQASEFEVVLAADSSVVGKGVWVATGQTTESSMKIVAVKDNLRDNEVDYTFQGTGPAGALLKGALPAGLPEETPLRLRVGADYSADFIISPKIYTYTRNALLRFFGLQQSKHGKDGAGKIVNGVAPEMSSREGALAGGWYDCGDHLKESHTQGYAASVLALMAAIHSAKDQDEYDSSFSLNGKTDGIPDMLAQAKHGADFALAAYDFAHGVIDNMPLSVGDFGSDHSFWGLPEVQEAMPVGVIGGGGALARDVRLGELGANISALFATNLALVSKLYAPYDAAYAAKCLQVAEEMYDFSKSLAQKKTTYGDGKPFVNNTIAAGWSSASYNGNNEFNDDLALASVALLYATQNQKYLSDAVQDKAILPSMKFMSGAGSFDGGWFATGDIGFLKNAKNTSWANSTAYALYALYKFIVETPAKASLYGIDEDYRRSLLEDIAYSMIYNLGDMSYGQGSASMTLPNKGIIGWKYTTFKYDPIWFTMMTDQTWIYNPYQAGNIVEVLMYADLAQSAEALSLGGVSDWKSKAMRHLGLDQLHYMLGLNPWDLSFVYGIGDKNDMHPHHRQANPEGRNVEQQPAYPYTVPTGGLYAGMAPGGTNAIEPRSASWEDYFMSEVCLASSATLFSGVTLVADSSKVLSLKPAASQLSGALQLQAHNRGDVIQVDALLPQSQGVSLQVLSLAGRVLWAQSLQGQAGANHWDLPLKGLQGMGIVRLHSGDAEKTALLSPLSR